MKKITRMFILLVSMAAASTYAANPASTDYVDKKFQVLETQIANRPAGTIYTAGIGIGIAGRVISNTSPGITYTAGTGINIAGNVISATGHFVGEYYQGGVIYWIDPADNTHGLIADINDAPFSSTTGYEWDNTGAPVVTGATGNKAYAGIANTALILSVLPSFNAEAATACANSTSQGFSDWYLPSIMELALMFDEQMTITRTAEAHGGTVFANVNNGNIRYWSSTEKDSFTAWSFYFNNGLQGYDPKSTPSSVRCARAF